MNKRKLQTSITLVFLLVTSSLLAQQYTFKVLGAKGDNFVDGQAVKVGSSILQSQTILLGREGYLGLAHSTNKTIEITKPGTYKVSDLEKMVFSASNDLAGRYTQFLVDELTSSGQDNNSRFNRRAKTGSVTRAVMGKPILFYLPVDENGVSRTSRVLAESKVTLKWYLNKKAQASSNSYKFIVKDGSPEAIGDVIFQKELQGNSISLDLSDPALQNRDVLLYQVVSQDGQNVLESEEMMLVMLKGQDSEKINAELSSLPREQSALNQMVIGRFFEEKGLVANAMQAYESALSISDLPTYRNYYLNFLNQYKLETSTVTVGK